MFRLAGWQAALKDLKFEDPVVSAPAIGDAHGCILGLTKILCKAQEANMHAPTPALAARGLTTW